MCLKAFSKKKQQTASLGWDQLQSHKSRTAQAQQSWEQIPFPCRATRMWLSSQGYCLAHSPIIAYDTFRFQRPNTVDSFWHYHWMLWRASLTKPYTFLACFNQAMPAFRARRMWSQPLIDAMNVKSMVAFRQHPQTLTWRKLWETYNTFCVRAWKLQLCWVIHHRKIPKWFLLNSRRLA